MFKKKIAYTGFSALNSTWKTNNTLAETTSLGEISAYLEKTIVPSIADGMVAESKPGYHKKAVPKSGKKTVAENVTQGIIDFDLK